MEDSENGGKGEIQERNRTVVNLPREKVEREIVSFWWSSTSIFEFFNFGRIVVFVIAHADFVPIYICHLSQPALSTR